MQPTERRTFLKIGAGSVAAMLNFLYPGLLTTVKASSRDTDTSATLRRYTGTVKAVGSPQAKYAFGTVVSKTSTGVVLLYQSKTRAVRIPATALVWKEFLTSPTVIEVNDWLDVKGTPLADGSLLASTEWVFVNIGRREGIISHVSPTGLAFTLPRGEVHTMELSTKLDVISVKDASPLAANGLKPGIAFGAVGLRLPNNGFRATRIWI